MEPRLVPVLYWLGALLLVDLGRRLASAFRWNRRSLLETLGVLGMLGWTRGQR
jgi:hypothetical protein